MHKYICGMCGNHQVAPVAARAEHDLVTGLTLITVTLRCEVCGLAYNEIFDMDLIILMLEIGNQAIAKRQGLIERIFGK